MTRRRKNSATAHQPAAPRGAAAIPRGRAGFTLIEVLATLMLFAIVLPVMMRAASVSTQAAAHAKRRNEAGSLAQSKLDEVMASYTAQTAQSSGGSGLTGMSGATGSIGSSGDFGPDWPDYKWSVEVQPWSQVNDANVQQLDVHVTWVDRGQQSVTLSTVVYLGGDSAATGAIGGGTGAAKTGGAKGTSAKPGASK